MRGRTAGAIGLAFATLLCLFASQAAATSYQRPFKEVFGPAEQPTFANSGAIAVNHETGEVLVLDNVGIKRYQADGTPAPFAALGSNVIDGEGSGTCTYPPTPSSACDKTPQNEINSGFGDTQIAVDESGGPTNGNIYITQNHIGPRYNLVDIFSSDGRYLGQLTSSKAGAFRAANGVGVDSSGVVYVVGLSLLGTARTTGVSKYVSTGNAPTNTSNTVTLPLPESDLPEGAYSTTAHLAIGTESSGGSLFVSAQIENTAKNNGPNIIKMDVDTGAGGRFLAGYGYGGIIAVDPTSGNLITSKGSNNELFEFDGAAAVAEGPISRLVAPADDVGVTSTGEVDLARGNQVLTYGQPAVVPTVTAEAATEVATATATLNGSVNPEGLVVSECFFEWGATTSYGNTAPCAEGLPPTDSEGHPVTAAISGLTPNGTTYHYRLAARNENGLERSGDETLRTAHTVQTGEAEVTGRHTATLKATVRPEGHQYTECVFEYGLATNTSAYEHTASCEPEAALIPADSGTHEVKADVSGLQEATAYRFRIKAANAVEGTLEGAEVTFTTFGPPQLAAIRASDATQSGATLEAEINPSGIETSYRFEWGPTASYGNTAPAAFESIGAGTAAVRVSAPISGLGAATTYHYRVVFENGAGTAQSADHTLETLNSCGLPDGRCFEMVSPRGPHPALPGETGAFNELHFQAAEQSGALAYITEVGYADAPRGGEVLYLGQRDEAGWESAPLGPEITIPDEQKSVTALPYTYFGLAPDLSCGVLGASQPLTADPVGDLILKAGGANLYRRNPDSTYTLITERPPEPLDGLGANIPGSFSLEGMTDDCSKVVFTSGYRYADVPGAKAGGLYEWTEAGGLVYVGFVPDGGGGEEAVAAKPAAYNALSEDGSRVFFTATRLAGKLGGEVGKTGLFVREAGVSTDISASETAKANEGVTFQGATPDGSRAYFTASAGLTSESSTGGTDLYEYDLASEELTDLSIAPSGAAEARALVGVADDGSRAYFLAQAQLIAGEGRTLAGNKAAKTLSLYANSDGGITFVATVSEADVGNLSVTKEAFTSRVSDDGRYLLFESSVDVTDYQSGGAPQAYLYDAEAGAGDPAVSCVSCRQDGLTPVGNSLPISFPQANHLYQPQTLSIRGGRPLVVFQSKAPLAPGGVAGKYNLYEWAGGQVFLIAASTPSEPFVGASLNGDDLYFFDTHALNWENPEARPQAWDARVGGGFAEPPAPPSPCDPLVEGSCASGPASGAAALPPSATSTYSGSGNISPKAHKNKKKHRKKAHKRKHKKATKGKSKRATNKNGRQAK